MEHVEILIEIAIGIAIVMEMYRSTIPNPISIAIARRPTPNHYYGAT
jgi:hypothetical protein